jgi:hypothetical protein
MSGVRAVWVVPMGNGCRAATFADYPLKLSRPVQVLIVVATLFLGQLLTGGPAAAGSTPVLVSGTRTALALSSHRVVTDELFGVSCTSASRCMAVGDHGNKLTTLTEAWNGTSWSVVDSPNPTNNGRFTAVSCVDPTFCMAVGYYLGYYPQSHRSFGGNYSLAELWNGDKWFVLPAPNPSTVQDQLNGISCTSTTQCMAVGFLQNVSSNVHDPLSEEWNGVSWSAVTNPATNAELSSVSCTSPKHCMAVGAVGGFDATFGEIWDGNTWSVLPTSNPSSDTLLNLTGISCANTSRCMAVGNAVGATTGAEITLAEEWSGGAWKIVPSASPGIASFSTFLSQASCISASGCIAIGSYRDRLGAYRSLAEHWSGDRWVFSSSPSPTLVSFLYAVSCTSASRCMAVGEAQVYPSIFTLTEDWDGSKWSIIPSPNA